MKTLNTLSINILFAILLFASIAFAQTNRGAGNRPNESAGIEKRFALVIGNSAYTSSPLKNPVNDAAAIAAALGDLGFEVTLKTNLKKDDMKRDIRAFGEKLKSGGIGLFYYAGHGVQVKGINYLVPVDAVINSEPEVEVEAIEAGSILAQMEAANNRMNFVILDACRNNPFPRSYRSDDKGLAQMRAPLGSLIAYSTAPDSVALDGSGQNSIYTTELIREMKAPNVDIKDVFQRVRVSVLNLTQNKQNPWESVSLRDNFYFKGNASATVVNIPPNPSIEITFWESIKDSKDIEDYKEYLTKFPNGQFAGIAQRRIKSLQNGGTNNPPPTNPPSSAPETWTVDASLFTFELRQCRLSGKIVVCDFIITNNDVDRKLRINNGNTLFDDFNNKSESKSIELANEVGYYPTAYLIKGVKTRARIIFEGISPDASRATLINITLSSEHISDFNIQYRNIPLRENTRSMTVTTTESGNQVADTQPLTNRDNNTTNFEVKPGQGWVDSGLNVFPGMKIQVKVAGGIKVKVDNSTVKDALSNILKRQINLPPGTKTVGGEALGAKVNFSGGGESGIIIIGNSEKTLHVSEGHGGRLYFAIADKYSSGNGTLSVTLKW